MKLYKYILPLIVSIFIVSGSVQAQDDPSLEETLDWIKWKVEDFGAGTYNNIYEDAKLKDFRIRSYIYTTTNLKFSFEGRECKLEYIQEIVPDTNTYNFLKINADMKFDLWDIETVVNAGDEIDFLRNTKDRIFDESILEEFLLLKTVNENLSITYSFKREKWDIENYAYEKYDTKSGKINYLLIHIDDEDIRERLLKAFNHAVKKAKESNGRKEIF
ncbi:MAG: hypothetical protein U5K00_16760 [Melioribacteraceae bacterium]|nr:hypothetical protein [Melioribacteraceae bacterium]